MSGEVSGHHSISDSFPQRINGAPAIPDPVFLELLLDDALGQVTLF